MQDSTNHAQCKWPSCHVTYVSLCIKTFKKSTATCICSYKYTNHTTARVCSLYIPPVFTQLLRIISNQWGKKFWYAKDFIFNEDEVNTLHEKKQKQAKARLYQYVSDQAKTLVEKKVCPISEWSSQLKSKVVHSKWGVHCNWQDKWWHEESIDTARRSTSFTQRNWCL